VEQDLKFVMPALVAGIHVLNAMQNVETAHLVDLVE
jgi:hypothetical protein